MMVVWRGAMAAGLLLAVAAVTAASIVALTLWRHYSRRIDFTALHWPGSRS